MYSVYQARFETKRGVVRTYIGYTGRMDVRMAFHVAEPPKWLKCQSGGELEYKILEGGIGSKGLAVAAEALHAARAVAAEPAVARGGPWAKPTLKKEWLRELHAAASLRSLHRLRALAEESPGGPLDRHLRDLCFVPASEALQGAAVCRGAAACRFRRSGTCGNRSRRNQLAKGTLKRGTARWKRLKRGADVAARRGVEQARRPPRPNASRQA